MRPIRLLHTADIHLEARFASLSAVKRKQRRLGLRRTFSRLVDAALTYQVDAMLIAGDLFDNPNPTKDTVDFVLAEINRLAEKDLPLVIVPGNHDFYSSDSIYAQREFPRNVHIFTSNNWESFALSNDITFFGIACHEFSSERNVLAELNNNLSAPGLNVAILHGSLDYGFYGREQCYPFSADDLAACKVDYLALGHYHNSILNPADNRAFYPGSPEGLKFSEKGQRHAFIVELGEGQVKVELFSVNRYLYEETEIDCTMMDSADDVKNILRDMAGDDRLLRVKLVGAPALSLGLDFNEEEIEQNFFFLDIINNFSLPEDAITDDENTVKSLYLKKMAGLLRAAEDPERRRELELAVRLGIAALDGRL